MGSAVADIEEIHHRSRRFLRIHGRRPLRRIGSCIRLLKLSQRS